MKARFLICGCGEKFTPEGRERACAACRKQALRDAQTRYRAKYASPHHPVEADADLRAVAKAVGLPVSTVHEIELRCFARIRKDPELLELYQNWVADGRPKPHLGTGDAGEKLLGYLFEIAEWYELVKELRAAQNPKAAEEVEQLIEQCHRLLKAELQRSHA